MQAGQLPIACAPHEPTHLARFVGARSRTRHLLPWGLHGRGRRPLRCCSGKDSKETGPECLGPFRVTPKLPPKNLTKGRTALQARQPKPLPNCTRHGRSTTWTYSSEHFKVDLPRAIGKLRPARWFGLKQLTDTWTAEVQTMHGVTKFISAHMHTHKLPTPPHPKEMKCPVLVAITCTWESCNPFARRLHHIQSNSIYGSLLEKLTG